MSADQARHYKWHDIPVEPMSATIGRQFLHSDTLMLARVMLAKGAHVPLHSHINEQFTYILSGALEFRLEGGIVVVRAGEVLTIPPLVPHEAFALEDTVDLDIFNPPRQDWIDRDDAYLRKDSMNRDDASLAEDASPGVLPDACHPEQSEGSAFRSPAPPTSTFT